MPEIDVVVRGPNNEGERAFLNIIQRFSEVRCSLEGLQEEPVRGSLWINKRTGEFVQGGNVERISNMDEIPSPYLLGLMDNFFKTGYFPILQITRGCPFRCTYCNSGVESNSKASAHSVDNVKHDLLYIANHIRPEIPLCFADDNFGMYQHDEEVADYIAYLSLISDFVREGQEELYGTMKECISSAHRNFEGLVAGVIGGHLLSKYSMLGRFYLTEDALKFLGITASDVISKSSADTKRVLLQAVIDYLRCVLLHVPFAENLTRTPTWVLSFDLEKWRAEGYVKSLEEYRFQKPVAFATLVEPNQKALIENKIATFGEHPSGLGKFTRTMFANDLRRKITRMPSNA